MGGSPQEKGPEDDGGTLTASAFSAHNSDQEGPRHFCGLQLHSPQTPQVWRMPGGPWGTRGEATVARGPPFSPHMAETSETFFLRPFFLPIPALLFFHVCGVGGQFLFKSWVLLNVGIHWILQGDVSDTSFIFSLHRIGTIHLPV